MHQYRATLLRTRRDEKWIQNIKAKSCQIRMNMHLAYETGRRISFLLYYASRVLNNTDSESQVCCIEKKDSFLYALCLGPCYCNCCRTCIEVSKKKVFYFKEKGSKLGFFIFAVSRALLFALPSQSRNAAIILHRHNTVQCILCKNEEVLFFSRDFS